MTGHGVLIINWFLRRLAGSPFAINRLVMLAAEALDRLSFEEAAKLAAHYLCDHECRGEAGFEEECYEACLGGSLAELKKLMESGRR